MIRNEWERNQEQNRQYHYATILIHSFSKPLCSIVFSLQKLSETEDGWRKAARYETTSTWRITWTLWYSLQNKKKFCCWFQWSKQKPIFQHVRMFTAWALLVCGMVTIETIISGFLNHYFVLYCFGKNYLSSISLGRKRTPHGMSLQYRNKFRLVKNNRLHTYSILILETISRVVKPAAMKLLLYWPIFMESSQSLTETNKGNSGTSPGESGILKK